MNDNVNGNESPTNEQTSSADTEEFKLTGDDILTKIKELVDEGNARRIILRNPDGHNLLEIPLTAGVLGAALLPVYAAVGAAVALAANLTIVVEKRT